MKLIHQIIDADHPVHKGISHNDHSSLLAATPTAESLKETVNEMIEVRICAHASPLISEGRPLALVCLIYLAHRGFNSTGQGVGESVGVGVGVGTCGCS